MKYYVAASLQALALQFVSVIVSAEQYTPSLSFNPPQKSIALSDPVAYDSHVPRVIHLLK